MVIKRTKKTSKEVFFIILLSLVINGKLGETLKSQYKKTGQVFEEVITKNTDKISKLEQKHKNNKEQLAIEFTQLLAEQIGVKGIEPKTDFGYRSHNIKILNLIA